MNEKIIEELGKLRPTKEQIGDNPKYAFAWIDAIEAARQLIKNFNMPIVSNNEVAVCECPKLHAVNRVCTYCKKIVPKSRYRKQTDC